MNELELFKTLDSNICELLEKNSTLLKNEIDAVKNSIQTNSNFHESLLKFYTSAVETGALATLKTLKDVGILTIS